MSLVEQPFSPASDPPRQHGIHLLSPAELRVANLLPDGPSNKEIALALGSAEVTVKIHLKTIQKKLGVKNRTQIAIAVERMRAGSTQGMRTMSGMAPEELEAYVRKAEKDIQRILLDLEEETERDVDFLRIDTRRFANLGVEIFLKDGN